ncbi:MAG: deoxyribodipyrimidine photo-lyase, partial [Pseudorhodoplanes sp.]
MADDLRSAAMVSAVVWFRDDLRLADHPALTAGANASTLTCIYVLDEDSPGLRPHGGASRWWLAQSLRTLDAALRTHGQRLVLRRGKAANVIPAIAREARATHVTWSRRYDRAGIAADDAVVAALKAQGLSGGTFPGNLLVEPGKVLTADGGPLRVFTPFWKRVLSLGEPRKPQPAPKQLPPPVDIASDSLEDWQLEPTKPDWAGGLR